MSRMKLSVSAWILLCHFAVIVGTDPVYAGNNLVFDRVTEVGTAADASPLFRLPKPTLPDNESVEFHSQVLEKIPARKESVEELMAAEAVSPFILQHRYLGDPESDCRIHAIDVWFVARGSLEQVDREDFAVEFFQAEGDAGKARVLDSNELKQRGIEEIGANETYGFGNRTILKKVLVETVSRTCVSRTEESVTIAGMVEPTFANDQEFPNRWSLVSPEKQTESVQSGTFQNAGYYTKMTSLKSAPGLLLVESHLVFEEPKQWFGTSRTLRSKLPIMFQSKIRAFRRRLSEQKSG